LRGEPRIINNTVLTATSTGGSGPL
jgi:hypothetical protein